jgi:hypothetical protein
MAAVLSPKPTGGVRTAPGVLLSLTGTPRVFDVLEVYEEELAKRSDLELVIGKRMMGFDADGILLPFSA